MLANNVALVRFDEPLAGRFPLDTGHGCIPVNLRAAVPRALRQRLRQVGRLDIPVIGMLDCADQPVGFAQRPDFFHLRRRQLVHLDADRLGHPGIIHELVPAILRPREADIRYLPEPDRLARFRLQRLVECHRIFMNLPDRVAHIEQRQQSRRVPCRTRGQFLALQQHNIAPPLFRQMIKRRDANNASTNDDDPCCGFHVLRSRLVRLYPCQHHDDATNLSLGWWIGAGFANGFSTPDVPMASSLAVRSMYQLIHVSNEVSSSQTTPTGKK